MPQSKELKGVPVWQNKRVEGLAAIGMCPEIAKVCIYAYSSGPLGVASGEAIWSIDIPSLIREWSAINITLIGVEFMSYSFLSGTTYAETNLNWYGDLVFLGSARTTYHNIWEKQSVSIGLPIVSGGVPLYNTLSIGIHHHTASTLGTGEVRAHTPILIFEVTSTEPFYDVRIKVWMDNTVVPNVTVRIEGTTEARTTDLSGETYFSLRAGSYTASVKAKIEDVDYIGSVKFTVPDQLYNEIWLEEKPLIPNWLLWVIGGSAILIVASVIIPPILERRRA